MGWISRSGIAGGRCKRRLKRKSQKKSLGPDYRQGPPTEKTSQQNWIEKERRLQKDVYKKIKRKRSGRGREFSQALDGRGSLQGQREKAPFATTDSKEFPERRGGGSIARRRLTKNIIRHVTAGCGRGKSMDGKRGSVTINGGGELPKIPKRDYGEGVVAHD